MFNTYVRKGGDTTIIKQQPNDAADAARLHGEIRDKARAEIVRPVIEHFGAKNELRVLKTHGEYAPHNDRHYTRALFTLNGQAYDVNVSVNRSLRDEVEKEIACAITVEILRQLRRREPQSRETET